MPWTQTIITLKDAAGNAQPLIAYTDGTNYSLAHPLLDTSGAIVAPATAGNQAAGNSSLTTIAANTANIPAKGPATSANSVPVVIASDQASLPLPTGAATDAKQDTGNASLVTIVTNTGNIPAKGSATSANSLPVVIASDQSTLPLPTGASTAANQTTANTSLAAIATNTSGVATAANQATANTSLAAITTSTGDLDTNLGAKADTAATTDTGTFSLIALFKRALQTLTTLSGTVATAANQTTANTSLATIATNTSGVATAANQSTANASLASLLTELQSLERPNITAGNTTTRPANTTAYAAGQLLANSTTAGSVTYPTIAAARANDQPGTILRLRLKKSGTTLTHGIFRVHLYNSQPTVTNGDGGTWLTTSSGYLGSFDVTMTQAFSDAAMGIGVSNSGSAVAFTPATGTQNLYYLIEVRDSYTPASGEVFTPYVEVA